jgi:uncharacterized protein with HEPN domain
MFRDYRVYLDDALEAVRSIENYTRGLTFEAFSTDRKTVDAVVRNLEIIGEAVKKVPAEVCSRHPEVEWKKISGLRDILIHHYFDIDFGIVWDIVVNKLPDLSRQIRNILSE